MGLTARLARLWSPPLEAPRTASRPDLVAIDLGCGRVKQPGTVGIDMVAGPGVDHVLDLRSAPLPFAEGSVGRVFSSHCIEHLADPTPLFREISRVSAHGARFELWTPYAWHDTAVFPDHVSRWTPEFYLHLHAKQWPYWQERLGARWHVDEFVYVIEAATQQKLRRRGFDLAFAVDHLHNVVAEFGVRGWIDKGRSPAPATAPRRCYAASRAASSGRCQPLEGGPTAPLRAELGRWARQTATRLFRG